jgi:anti-sigma regulatory factor (Ser/Thr protein kinase)
MMARSPMSEDPIVRTEQDGPHAMAVFAREVLSVASAREWLGRFLSTQAVPSTAVADAALVLSELVTNALRHGLGQIVTFGSVDHDEIRLSVTDSGDELPDLQPVERDRIGGLGLHVVGQVADEWGVAPFPGGKTVWATLHMRPAG